VLSKPRLSSSNVNARNVYPSRAAAAHAPPFGYLRINSDSTAHKRTSVTADMFTTRALRQAAAHAERTPLIKFLGPRTIPCEHTSNPDAVPPPC